MMASRSLRIWLGLAPIVLLAMACESVGAADHTLALCESALERRLAIENDQARFNSTATNPVPLSHLATFENLGGGYAVEWERLEAQHAEAQSDINAHCLEPAGIATPTPSPTPTVTPTPTPTPTPGPPTPTPTLTDAERILRQFGR